MLRKIFSCRERCPTDAKDVLLPRKMFACRERDSTAAKDVLLLRKIFCCSERPFTAAQDVVLLRKIFRCHARCRFIYGLLSSVFGLWLSNACVIYPLLSKDISKFGLHSPALLHMSFASQLACTHLASQRSLHNAPIFRLLLKVAVNGTHQCDFSSGIAHEPTS